MVGVQKGKLYFEFINNEACTLFVPLESATGDWKTVKVLQLANIANEINGQGASMGSFVPTTMHCPVNDPRRIRDFRHASDTDIEYKVFRAWHSYSQDEYSLRSFMQMARELPDMDENEKQRLEYIYIRSIAN